MRIVSGKYKGRRIDPPKKFPSRPTTDMAKEGLFNILTNQIDWEDVKVLDLFAGTGNVSVEFLSRGAKSVLSVDKHPICIKHLNALQETFADENWMILRKDVFQLIDNAQQKFDLIFADPPFNLKGLNQLPDLILKSGLLDQGGIIVIEHGQEVSFEEHPNLTDSRKYGGVFFSFFS
ncbi:16S rRNA (guanine(966)-N(2))-methyltransferase RsmD [Paracrocinitomix mangrovi]|uniref:16S rRNA (guanine(966)-N(2))-methyltransferase RsmD n=1 Tax=Paracrocinitomix mangrovi TaxID=2862509 RepID=UPI001C8D9297|nr:16S rRNA (guanine(966)-N(2))-methyltransferase RsmD [Paracrocinitomix mangrovi]UKN01436.1 16S rRNA (guanine(966)-N(2))-methyltransferase RsmD [Paracrocinitomix mangrovi]